MTQMIILNTQKKDIQQYTKKLGKKRNMRVPFPIEWF